MNFRLWLAKFARLDPAVLVLTLALSAAGIVLIESASIPIERPLGEIQTRFFVYGCIGMIAVALVPYPKWVKLGPLAYFGLLGLLVAVATIGTTVNGSQRWLTIGSFQFQPSEPMKTALVLMLAACFRRGEPVKRVRDCLPLLILAMIPFFLVARQPDLGTALMYIPIALGILFIGGLPFRAIFFMSATGAALAYAGFRFLLHPYQRERIISTFFRENLADYERAREGFQLLQSLRAVEGGGLSGQGYRLGVVTQSGTLSHSYNDFIFSTIAEEHGFVGASLVLLAVLLLVLACYRVGYVCRDPSGRVLCTGVGTLIAAQALVNAGVAIGLVPTTGIALPFLSSGGSALVSMMMAVGLVLSVSVHPIIPMNRPSVERNRPSS